VAEVRAFDPKALPEDTADWTARLVERFGEKGVSRSD
jgi:hypothetical protein